MAGIELSENGAITVRHEDAYAEMNKHLTAKDKRSLNVWQNDLAVGATAEQRIEDAIRRTQAKLEKTEEWKKLQVLKSQLKEVRQGSKAVKMKVVGVIENALRDVMTPEQMSDFLTVQVIESTKQHLPEKSNGHARLPGRRLK